MTKETEILERLFNDFINIENDRDFYLGFIQYFTFALTISNVKQKIDDYISFFDKEEEIYKNTDTDKLALEDDFTIEVFFVNNSDRKYKIWTEVYFVNKLYEALNIEIIKDSKKLIPYNAFIMEVTTMWRNLRDGRVVKLNTGLDIVKTKQTMRRVHNQLIIDIQNEKTKNNILSKLDLYGSKLAITKNAAVFIDTNGKVTEARVASKELRKNRTKIFEFKNGKIFFLGKELKSKHQDTDYLNVLNFILINYRNHTEFSFKEFVRGFRKKQKIIDRANFTSLLMNKNKSLLLRLNKEFKDDYNNIPFRIFEFKNRGSDTVIFINKLK